MEGYILGRCDCPGKEEKMKKGSFVLIVVAVFGLMVTTAIAQTTSRFTEFPIAVGADSTGALSVAFDGTNYLVGIQGDTLNNDNITAQLVSQSGSLVGSRISVGRTGGVPWVAFDGSNYLMVWGDDATNDVYGQFIGTAGNLVGTAFPIAWTAYNEKFFGGIAFGDSFYLVPWLRNDTLFGRRIDKSGNLVGGVIKISSNTAHDWGSAIAFDGTNYLVAWTDNVNDREIYGQLISKSGVLVGSNFIIDDSPYFSDNPGSISFDGSRYMVCFPDEVDTTWDLFARFVTTSGIVAERVTISDAPGNQHFPCIDFDGTNYLITWGDDRSSSTDWHSKGRFFDTSGVPVDTVFTIFDTLDNKLPIGAPVVFGGYQYLTITTRALDLQFIGGDVYGAFVPPYTGVEEKPDVRLEMTDFSLQQNAPNPFMEQTIIQYQLKNDGFVDLSIYDVAGQKIKTLINEYVRSGVHTCSWNGRDKSGKKVASGMYLVRLKTGNKELTTKMVVVK